MCASQLQPSIQFRSFKDDVYPSNTISYPRCSLSWLLYSSGSSRLNTLGDRIQPWCTPRLILISSENWCYNHVLTTWFQYKLAICNTNISNFYSCWFYNLQHFVVAHFVERVVRADGTKEHIAVIFIKEVAIEISNRIVIVTPVWPVLEPNR